MKPGAIYLVQFPFSDGSAAKLRPIMVISNEEMNQSEDVVVVPISSRPDKDDPFSIYVGGMDFSAAGLKMDSSIKWTKPTTLAKSVLGRRLGHMPVRLIDETRRKVREMLGG